MPESVAGRRWQALCRPHPQNVRPPPKQVGRRSPVAESETDHNPSLFGGSRQKMAAILHRRCIKAHRPKNRKSAYRRFKLAGMGGTGKNGSLTS
ncbi:hypothetical protein [Xenorhabdus budapestensis]|uniref:hypothetical protein n=1 Tax=Xenorhabdus budapestensis TaxID=290110 RepID=UPI0011AB7686|nr:hypothetical protein [Xenorhabdus budapestensis]